MKRLFSLSLLLVGLFLLNAQTAAAKRTQTQDLSAEGDRIYWCRTAYRVAHPVLDAMSRGQLRATMPVEQLPGSGRDSVSQLEAFGRTICGIAPWLESGQSTGEEGRLRAELTALALASLKQLADPASPDYLPFCTKDKQPLVDAAFLAQGLMRAPNALWGALDKATQKGLIDQMRSSRAIRPWTSNWLLFSAMIETFFLFTGEDADLMRIDYAVKQHEDWYKGDGTYGDGPVFHWDYYNSFVIQPMMLDVVKMLRDKNLLSSSYHKDREHYYDRVLARAQRYAAIQERLISPEGTFPAIGRSLTYRIGAFHLLEQIALQHALPEEIAPAQVRCALTAVMKRLMEAPGTFDAKGWLTLGFCGHQPALAENYVSTGSTYMCAAGFVALGLPASDPFWSAPDAPWTQVKIWGGENVPGDHALNDN